MDTVQHHYEGSGLGDFLVKVLSWIRGLGRATARINKVNKLRRKSGRRKPDNASQITNPPEDDEAESELDDEIKGAGMSAVQMKLDGAEFGGLFDKLFYWIRRFGGRKVDPISRSPPEERLDPTDSEFGDEAVEQETSMEEQRKSLIPQQF